MNMEIENRIWEMHKMGLTEQEIAKELELDLEEVEKSIEQRKKEQVEHEEERERTPEEVQDERECNEQLDKEIEAAMLSTKKRMVNL